MSSDTHICNLALGKIGEEPITALTEDSKAGRACNLVYSDLRKALLRAHPWNFAIKRATLAQLTTTPDFGFTYEYQLPSDFLKLVNTSYEEYLDVKYKIEGKKLLTDETTFSIVYVYDLKDGTFFDSLFVDTLATRIAAELAVSLSNDAQLKRDKMQEYSIKLSEAKSGDSQDEVPEEFITTTWLDSRL